MGSYIALFFPQFSIVPIAITIAICLGIINLMGSKSSGGLQILLVFGLLVILLAFITGGFSGIQTDNFKGIFNISSDSLIATSAMVYISYVGVTNVASLSEEVKKPEKDLPLGIFLALGVAMLIYALGTTVMVGVVPMDRLAGDLTPVATAANFIFGRVLLSQ